VAKDCFFGSRYPLLNDVWSLGWYGLHGKHEQAEKALRRINGNVKGYDAAYECKSNFNQVDMT
jgi:hypothetical protein